jgi:hypothetical protein
LQSRCRHDEPPDIPFPVPSSESRLLIAKKEDRRKILKERSIRREIAEVRREILFAETAEFLVGD